MPKTEKNNNIKKRYKQKKTKTRKKIDDDSQTKPTGFSALKIFGVKKISYDEFNSYENFKDNKISDFILLHVAIPVFSSEIILLALYVVEFCCAESPITLPNAHKQSRFVLSVSNIHTEEKKYFFGCH